MRLLAADQIDSQHVTTLRQFHELAPDQSARALPVEIRGVVLCWDAEWQYFFLSDGVSTSYIPPAGLQADLHAGDQIELRGNTALASGKPVLTNLQVTVVGRRPLPRATDLDLGQWRETVGQWVYFRGRVRVAETSHGRLGLVLENGGRTCLARVMGPLPPAADQARYRDQTVLVRAISVTEGSGEQGGPVLIIPGIEWVKTERSTASSYRRDPVVTVESLLNRPLGPWTNEPVHLKGTVSSYRPGGYVVIRDPTGVMRASIVQGSRLEVAEMVDLWGCLTVASGEVFLKNAWFEVSQSADRQPKISASVKKERESHAPTVAPLTKAVEIKHLRREDAAEARAVRLHGVVTYADAAWNTFFVQDNSAGIYVESKQQDVKCGQWVEVTGVTWPGDFAPGIAQGQFRILHPTNPPTATMMELPDAMDGHLDAKWVSMEGVVRSVTAEAGHLRLVVTTPEGVFRVLAPGRPAPPPTNLVSILVNVTGACGSDLNARGQVNGVTLHVPDMSWIKPLEPIPADPFELAATAIGTIATFEPDRLAGRRVKVRGRVSLALPYLDFYVQDGSGGIRVQFDEGSPLNVGDTVEVLGIPVLRNGLHVLEEATYRVTASEPFPTPHLSSAERIVMHPASHATMVRLQGRLVHYFSQCARPKLVFQDGNILFSASLLRRGLEGSVPELRPGSLVQVTGICLLRGSGGLDAEAFRLIISDPAQLTLMETGPWWTVRHTQFLFAGTSTLILIALAWISILRRQVRSQTDVIRQQLGELKDVADSLVYERDLLNTLMDNLPDPIYFKDLESRFVRVSRAKLLHCHARALASWYHREKQTGEALAQLPEHLQSLEAFQRYLPGRTGFDFFAHEDAQRAFDDEQAIIRTRAPIIGKLEERSLPDGKSCWLLVTKMPWLDKAGNVIGTFGISKDITSIKEAEARLEALHRQLIASSRQAGMAEVATSVLHNVGNVLNSVNVSASLVAAKVKESRISGLASAVELLKGHAEDLGRFFAEDPKGRKLPDYLARLSGHLTAEQQAILAELQSLTANIEHIKDIVTMQQAYSRVAGFAEKTKPADLVEDALRMNSGALARHGVEVRREYQANLPDICVEKHKVLQILVNLIRNAKYACDESSSSDKHITLSVRNGQGRVKISVTDNGVGIPPENMTRIFNHGFTTRRGGHGFGLHSGALTAKELGGTLSVQSDGPGLGATFTLELPQEPKKV